MFQELLHCSHLCLTSLLGHTKGIFSLMCTEHSISSRTVHQYISWRSCCENIFSVRYVFQATACLVDTLHLIQNASSNLQTFGFQFKHFFAFTVNFSFFNNRCFGAGFVLIRILNFQLSGAGLFWMDINGTSDLV